MVMAPLALRDAYLLNLYQTITGEAKNHWKMVELKTRELEVKEGSLQLQEALMKMSDEFVRSPKDQ